MRSIILSIFSNLAHYELFYMVYVVTTLKQRRVFVGLYIIRYGHDYCHVCLNVFNTFIILFSIVAHRLTLNHREMLKEN